MHSRCFFVDFPALTAVTAIQRYQRHLQSSRLAPQEICPLLLMQTCIGNWSPSLLQHLGHSCKIGNMRCPGTLKNQNPQFEEKNKFFCFFMFLYPIQGGKNNGSPYLTNKSWFLANLMSRDNKIKVTLVLWHPRTLFF